MTESVLQKIRDALDLGEYDVTKHAYEELAEDELDISDLEAAVATGELIRVQRDDPRRPRYTVSGLGTDPRTRVAFVCRFTDTGVLVIITAFRPTEQEVQTMYGYRCEYCEGTVREKHVKREAFKHKVGFVILEDVPIGVCDSCGMRYYHASLLHRVAAVATGTADADRTEIVPVANAV